MTQRNGNGKRPRGPLHPEIGVIGLVPDNWGWGWMPRHHVLTRLAKYFNVVWFDPAYEWRHYWLNETNHDTNKYGKQFRWVTDADPVIAGFSIYRPGRWLPRLFKPRVADRITTEIRIRQACDQLRERGVKKFVLYVWRPNFAYKLDLVDHDYSIYHIDDEYSFSPTEVPLDPKEVDLIRRVDHVVVHSPGLMERKGGLNPNTTFVPNGVNYQAFSSPRDEPEDLRAIPHPRIGYTGYIKEQLDLELMLGLAQRHREWSFVFVGPNRVTNLPEMKALQALPNTYFLHGKPPGDLPAYMQHVDVNIMPYLDNAYTRCIYPLKLHEYLATGRPVVTTPLPAVLEFFPVLNLANTLNEWSRGLTRALDPVENTEAAVRARRDVARSHDWDQLVEQIAQIIHEGVVAATVTP